MNLKAYLVGYMTKEALLGIDTPYKNLTTGTRLNALPLPEHYLRKQVLKPNPNVKPHGKLYNLVMGLPANKSKGIETATPVSTTATSGILPRKPVSAEGYDSVAGLDTSKYKLGGRK